MHQWQRRSSSMRTTRPSIDLPRNSRLTDRSRIPLPRSSSNHASRASQHPAGLVRSKSTLGYVTPQHHMGSSSKITPQMTPMFGFGGYSTSKKPAGGKEKRDLGDKAFQREAQSLVVRYFRDHHPSVLENNDMRPMTQKMFLGMINHLLNELEFHMKGEFTELTLSTYETDLPVLLVKHLDYPGVVSKSWLKTVSAPQTLGHVLGVLSWLVDLVQIFRSFDPAEAFIETANIDCESMLIHSCTIASYNYFNDESAIKEISTELNAAICQLLGVSDEVINELTSQLAVLEKEAEVDDETQRDEEIAAELELKLSVALAQAKKADEDYKSLKEGITQEIALKEKRERNCAILIADTQKALETTEKLKKEVANQAMSVDECIELKRECENLSKDINYSEKESEENMAVLSRYEHDMATKRDKIQQCASSFNRQVIQLAQKVPELQGLRVRLDPESVDIIEDVDKLAQHLTRLKDKTAANYTESEKILREKQLKINRLKKELEDVKNEAVDIEKRSVALATSIQDLIRKCDQEEKSHKNDIENLEQRLDGYRKAELVNNKLREDVATLEQRLVDFERLKVFHAEKAEEQWERVEMLAKEYYEKMCGMRDQIEANEAKIEAEIDALIAELKKT